MKTDHQEQKTEHQHSNRLLEMLRCPLHPNEGSLQIEVTNVAGTEALSCDECGRRFSMIDGIADMVVPDSQAEFMVSEARQWDEHAVRYDRTRAQEAIYLAGVEAAAEALCARK